MEKDYKTKIGLTTLIVILLVLAWTSYKNPKIDDVKVTNTMSNGAYNVSPTAGGPASDWIPSVSFTCKDNSHFIAEFPNANEVVIIVDGKIVQTAPHTSGAGQRFENDGYVYVFAGEEVTVTNKTTKKTTTCEQPKDPNNAPVNFGDAAEGGTGFGVNAKQDVSFVVQESIVGTWKSTDDSRFTREFTSSGTVVDFYDGKAVTTGKWQLFTSEKPLKVSFPIEKGAIYVQMTVSGTQGGDTLSFKLAKLTPENLELIYMDRGGVNSFTRIR